MVEFEISHQGSLVHIISPRLTVSDDEVFYIIEKKNVKGQRAINEINFINKLKCEANKYAVYTHNLLKITMHNNTKQLFLWATLRWRFSLISAECSQKGNACLGKFHPILSTRPPFLIKAANKAFAGH